MLLHLLLLGQTPDDVTDFGGVLRHALLLLEPNLVLEGQTVLHILVLFLDQLLEALLDQAIWLLLVCTIASSRCNLLN